MLRPCREPESAELRVDDPVWEPLLEVLGERLTAQFMWMYAADLPGGATLHAYKHRWTRCYIFLTEDSRAFEWTACGRYAPTRLDWAIERALCSWWLLAGWTPEDRDAIHEAVLRAQEDRLGAA